MDNRSHISAEQHFKDGWHVDTDHNGNQTLELEISPELPDEEVQRLKSLVPLLGKRQQEFLDDITEGTYGQRDLQARELFHYHNLKRDEFGREISYDADRHKQYRDLSIIHDQYRETGEGGRQMKPLTQAHIDAADATEPYRNGRNFIRLKNTAANRELLRKQYGVSNLKDVTPDSELQEIADDRNAQIHAVDVAERAAAHKLKQKINKGVLYYPSAEERFLMFNNKADAIGTMSSLKYTRLISNTTALSCFGDGLFGIPVSRLIAEHVDASNRVPLEYDPKQISPLDHVAAFISSKRQTAAAI